METYCVKMMDLEKCRIDNRLAPKSKAKYYVNWADKCSFTGSIED